MEFAAQFSGWARRFTAAALVLLVAGCEPSSRNKDKEDSAASFDLGKVAWYGPNYSGAVRDERAVLHSAVVELGRNAVHLSYDPLPGDWPRMVNAPGMLALFEELEDGSWRGGKFEWLDPGQTVKSLKNIDNRYNGWQRPRGGARVAVIVFSTDGRRRSNAAYSVYK